MRAPLAVLLAAFAAGCTVVRIEDPGSLNVQVSQRFGFVAVDIHPGTGAVIVDSTTLGIVNAADGLAFGFHTSKLAAVAPGDCRLVVWVQSPGEIKELEQLLRTRTDVCVVDTDHSRRER